MLNVGDKLQGRYEIKEIRMGGFRVVYIAHDYLSEKLVMVETLRDEYLDHKDLIERFLEQSRIVMKLRGCPHVVRAERVARIGDKLYIFWEYVDGWTLREEIQNHRLDLIRSLDVAIQFCDGMDCVHNVDLGDGRRGVVHRDVKPDHVWITRHGVVKITDFGMAKPLGSSTGFMAGTPPYMSPEQFHATDVDQRSDIYSFGAVLYEMLTGQMVFPMRHRSDVSSSSGWWSFYEHHHTEVPPEPPRRINPSIPLALEQVVLKCLEKKPKDRFQSFKDLRKVLDDIYFEISGKRVTIYAGPPPEVKELTYKGRARVNLGIAYHSKGLLDQAITELKRAIELDPNNVGAHVNLGNTYLRMGWLNQAITEYNRAVELDPNLPAAHFHLGLAYGRKGWRDQEIAEYQLAIELDPNDAAAHFNLAIAYYGSGRFDLAWKHIRIAEKLGVPTQDIDQLIAALRKISREP